MERQLTDVPNEDMSASASTSSAASESCSTEPEEPLLCAAGGNFMHALWKKFSTLDQKHASLGGFILIKDPECASRLEHFFHESKLKVVALPCLFDEGAFTIVDESRTRRRGWALHETCFFPFRLTHPVKDQADEEDTRVCLAMVGTLDSRIVNEVTKEELVNSRRYHAVDLVPGRAQILFPASGEAADCITTVLIHPVLASYNALFDLLMDVFRLLVSAMKLQGCNCARSSTDSACIRAQPELTSRVFSAHEMILDHPARCSPRESRDRSLPSPEQGGLITIDASLVPEFKETYKELLARLPPDTCPELGPLSTDLQESVLLPLPCGRRGVLVIDPQRDRAVVFWDNGRAALFRDSGLHPIARGKDGLYRPIALRVILPDEDLVLDLHVQGQSAIPVPCLLIYACSLEGLGPLRAIEELRRRLEDGTLAPFYYHYDDGCDMLPWTLTLPPHDLLHTADAPQGGLARYVNAWFRGVNNACVPATFMWDTTISIRAPFVAQCMRNAMKVLETGTGRNEIVGALGKAPGDKPSVVMTWVEGVLVSSALGVTCLKFFPTLAVDALQWPDTQRIDYCMAADFPVLKRVKDELGLPDDSVSLSLEERVLHSLLIDPGKCLEDLVHAAEAKSKRGPIRPLTRKRLSRAFSPVVLRETTIAAPLETLDPDYEGKEPAAMKASLRVSGTPVACMLPAAASSSTSLESGLAGMASTQLVSQWISEMSQRTVTVQPRAPGFRPSPCAPVTFNRLPGPLIPMPSPMDKHVERSLNNKI